MKKNRILALLTAVALLVGLLSGCLAAFTDVGINADGSGSITVKIGATKEALETLSEMSEEPLELPEETFEYNGTTYYGETETVEFADLTELEYMMNSMNSQVDERLQTYTFAQNEAGYIAVTLVAPEQEELNYSDLTDIEMTEEQFQVIADSIAAVDTFQFPGTVRQVKGASQGVTVEGKTLTLDLMQLTAGEVYYFTTDPAGKFVVEPAEVVYEEPVWFTDVPGDASYASAVYWAVDGGITKGTGENQFSPYMSCDRAQVVTFLHRALGAPSVEGTSLNFVDVPQNAWYRDAVLWAVESGVTNGTGPDTFSPNVVCSPVEVITFLYRAMGQPNASSVPATWYSDAVAWATQNGLLVNTVVPFTTDTTVACPRADIVTYLYRALSGEYEWWPNIVPEPQYSGKVMLYSSMQEEQLMALRDAFQAKYPNVRMEYYFAGTSKVVTKITTEAQAGHVAADVIWVGDACDYVSFKEQGILQQYISPEATPDVIDPCFVDPEGYYTAGRLVGVGIGYNTELVKATEAPKTWNDLLDPKWKGWVVMANPGEAGTTKYWMNAMMCNDKYGADYMQKLKKNGCELQSGTTATHANLAAGAYKVGVCLDYVTANLANEGAPIAFVYPEDTVAIPYPIGLVKNANNEENGKLLYDFLLSKEAQEIMAQNNLISVRKDVAQTTNVEEVAQKTMQCDVAKMANETANNLTTFNQIFGLEDVTSPTPVVVPPTPTATPTSQTGQYSGKVRLYTILQEDQIEALRQAFQAKYPNVSMEYYFAANSKVVTKITTEAQAGVAGADVIFGGDATDFVSFKEAGILQQYTSSELASGAIDPAFVDPDGYYTAGRLAGVGIAYNTDLVKATEAPKTWNDLLDPKWKDQVVMSDPGTAGTTKYWMNAMMCNDKYGADYMQKLKENGCELQSGTNATHIQLAAGYYKVGVCVDYVTANRANEGAPIAFVYPEDTVAIPFPIGLVKNADNEENGKLLYDFLLSKEAQEIMAQNNLISVRNDVVQTCDVSEIAKKAMQCDYLKMVSEHSNNLTTFNKIFGLV